MLRRQRSAMYSHIPQWECPRLSNATSQLCYIILKSMNICIFSTETSLSSDLSLLFFFFLNDRAPPEISPFPPPAPFPFGASRRPRRARARARRRGERRAASRRDPRKTPPPSLVHRSQARSPRAADARRARRVRRSEEHTSELQSPCNLVCRLLLEKKKTSC